MEFSRADIVSVIDRLLAGDLSREDASAWAAARHAETSSDVAIEDAFDGLALIDACHTSAIGDDLYDFREITEAREALLR